MSVKRRITPFLWFDNQAEQAAQFYVSVFDNSRINNVVRYPNTGQEVHGREGGSVMIVEFEIDGQAVTALNGGPHFRPTEAFSFVVACETQEEIDRYWAKLGEGGDPKAQQCGWLKDQFGLSWQIVPEHMERWFGPQGKGNREAVMQAMLKMQKLDIAELERAYQS